WVNGRSIGARAARDDVTDRNGDQWPRLVPAIRNRLRREWKALATAVDARRRDGMGSNAVMALKWLLIVAVCGYVALTILLYFAQRSMMYFPETIHTTPAQAGLPEAEEIALTASDGVHIVGWHVPPRDGKPVILYFHGNGGALRYRVQRFHE